MSGVLESSFPVLDFRFSFFSAIPTGSRPNLFRPSTAQYGLLRPVTAYYGYSHSMVAGGLLEMSKTTRFTPLTSLTMRLESFSRKS